MMAITRRGENLYLIRVYVGRDPISGRRIEINETFKGKLEGAQKREQVLKKQARKGSLSLSSNMTVDHLIDSYLELNRHRVSKITLHSLTHRFALYVRPYIGSRKIRKIKMSDVQALLNFLLDPKKEKNGGKK